MFSELIFQLKLVLAFSFLINGLPYLDPAFKAHQLQIKTHENAIKAHEDAEKLRFHIGLPSLHHIHHTHITHHHTPILRDAEEGNTSINNNDNTLSSINGNQEINTPSNDKNPKLYTSEDLHNSQSNTEMLNSQQTSSGILNNQLTHNGILNNQQTNNGILNDQITNSQSTYNEILNDQQTNNGISQPAIFNQFNLGVNDKLDKNEYIRKQLQLNTNEILDNISLNNGDIQALITPFNKLGLNKGYNLFPNFNNPLNNNQITKPISDYEEQRIRQFLREMINLQTKQFNQQINPINEAQALNSTARQAYAFSGISPYGNYLNYLNSENLLNTRYLNQLGSSYNVAPAATKVLNPFETSTYTIKILNPSNLGSNLKVLTETNNQYLTEPSLQTHLLGQNYEIINVYPKTYSLEQINDDHQLVFAPKIVPFIHYRYRNSEKKDTNSETQSIDMSSSENKLRNKIDSTDLINSQTTVDRARNAWDGEIFSNEESFRHVPLINLGIGNSMQTTNQAYSESSMFGGGMIPPPPFHPMGIPPYGGSFMHQGMMGGMMGGMYRNADEENKEILNKNNFVKNFKNNLETDQNSLFISNKGTQIPNYVELNQNNEQNLESYRNFIKVPDLENLYTHRIINKRSISPEDELSSKDENLIDTLSDLSLLKETNIENKENPNKRAISESFSTNSLIPLLKDFKTVFTNNQTEGFLEPFDQIEEILQKYPVTDNFKLDRTKDGPKFTNTITADLPELLQSDNNDASRTKRTLAFLRLITHPDQSVNVPKTIDNINNVALSPELPLYHVRNAATSGRKAVDGTFKSSIFGILFPNRNVENENINYDSSNTENIPEHLKNNLVHFGRMIDSSRQAIGSFKNIPKIVVPLSLLENKANQKYRNPLHKPIIIYEHPEINRENDEPIKIDSEKLKPGLILKPLGLNGEGSKKILFVAKSIEPSSIEVSEKLKPSLRERLAILKTNLIERKLKNSNNDLFKQPEISPASHMTLKEKLRNILRQIEEGHSLRSQKNMENFIDLKTGFSNKADTVFNHRSNEINNFQQIKAFEKFSPNEPIHYKQVHNLQNNLDTEDRNRILENQRNEPVYFSNAHNNQNNLRVEEKIKNLGNQIISQHQIENTHPYEFEISQKQNNDHHNLINHAQNNKNLIFEQERLQDAFNQIEKKLKQNEITELYTEQPPMHNIKQNDINQSYFQNENKPVEEDFDQKDRTVYPHHNSHQNIHKVTSITNAHPYGITHVNTIKNLHHSNTFKSNEESSNNNQHEFQESSFNRDSTSNHQESSQKNAPYKDPVSNLADRFNPEDIKKFPPKDLNKISEMLEQFKHQMLDIVAVSKANCREVIMPNLGINKTMIEQLEKKLEEDAADEKRTSHNFKDYRTSINPDSTSNDHLSHPAKQILMR